MNRLFPILDWLKNYSRQDASGDITAGLTVGIMLIPQGMAYAMLAGLPPIYGLYAATIPLIVYGLLGRIPQLAIGPVAIVSLLVSRGIGDMAVPGTEEYIAFAILLAFMVGVLQLTMGLFRLGFLVNFLSHPVVAGFITAAGIIIGFSQLQHLVGFEISKKRIYQIILELFGNLRKVHFQTLMIGLSSIALLLSVKQINKRFNWRIPGPLIVVLFGLLIAYFFKLDGKQVALVKHIPEGLPRIGLPMFDTKAMISLLPIAVTIGFIGFIESMAIAKALKKKEKHLQIRANGELVALGLANIFGSIFKAFPVTAGFSRTAVNYQAGARTGVASILSACIVLLTLLFLTSWFYYLPLAVLAAIIMVAVIGLIDLKEAKHLWQTDRIDFALFVITACGTMVFGIEIGIILGVLLSLAMVIYNVSYPNIAVLGQIPGKNSFREIARFNNLVQHDNILIVRIDAPIYFANADYIKDYIYDLVDKRDHLKHLVFDASPISHIDSTAFHLMKDMINDLGKKDILVHFCQVNGKIRDVLKKNHMFDAEKKSQYWLRLEDAITFIKKAQKDITKRPYIFQANQEN